MYQTMTNPWRRVRRGESTEAKYRLDVMVPGGEWCCVHSAKTHESDRKAVEQQCKNQRDAWERLDYWSGAVYRIVCLC